MARLIILTPQPVIVTSKNTYQDINQALDVASCDLLDLQLGVLSVAGSGTTTVNLYTSMSKTFDDIIGGAWSFTAGTGFSVTGVGYQGAQFPNGSGKLLRYIRWGVPSFSGFTSVQFVIQGMARRTLF